VGGVSHGRGAVLGLSAFPWGGSQHH